MPKRKTVEVNISAAKKEIKEKCRSNVVFCELMGKHIRWVTDWNRKHNLPSPEEAARMCAILNVTPEEILTEPEDIELVTGLIKAEAEKAGQLAAQHMIGFMSGQEERPAPEGEPNKLALLDYIDTMDIAGIADIMERANLRLKELTKSD